ncbi:MAG: histidine kinase [Coriobacteriales bacterium]|jgi:signal transduction histidine kinase
MDRILDKLVVFVCCLPALATVPVGAPLVAAMLVAVGVAAANEALTQDAPFVARGGLAAVGGPAASEGGRRVTVARGAGAALSAGYLVAACAVPAAVPFVALAVYDLACRRATAPLALVTLVSAGLAAGAGVPAVELGVLACSCALAVTLSLRTGRIAAQRAENLRERDRLRERSIELERSNRDLLDRQEYEARLATLTERARIAREIHDNVGHLLTRGVMQVEALKVIHADDPQVRDEFGSVADTLREALDTMRASVHGMADDACDLSVQVRQVVEDACRGTGLSANCDVAATTASPQVTACLTAVVREALSNTLRHADGATHVHVELVEHPGFWRLTVTDNGRRPATPAAAAPAAEAPVAASGGMGLRSMEQRVRALGGTMSAGYSRGAHGFVVYASIPRRGSAA